MSEQFVRIPGPPDEAAEVGKAAARGDEHLSDGGEDELLRWLP